ncbi:ribosome-recycling factor, mitochondrial [Parasteatoda tepidariorum]|uniref:ribosome-recycling factor, mitochondrial n=1 Tax=Parasteatoda tepidariorum TaxID=114398 RepID=UPI00077F8700|nr:ribosome-recycling factor, mitochondrial [Parasteatoda tepidariorum]
MEIFIKLRTYSKLLKTLKMKPPSVYKSCSILYSNVIPIESTRRNILVVTPLQLNHVCFAKKAQGKMSKGGGKSKIAQLSDEEIKEVIDIEDYRNQLLTVKEKLKKEYVENLSLRSASNVENIMVKIDDDEYPLHELAQISRKNQNLIAINLIDFPEALKPAIQSIIDSGIGINPQQDGTMIYLTIPKMTREHREHMAKSAKSMFMKAKDEIRSIQNYFVKEAKGKTDLSEDLIFNASNMIQNVAELNVAELEKVLKIKQKELLGET